MNDRRLEKMLREMRRSDVPEDLREKLIRTIPPRYRAAARRRRLPGGKIMKPLFAGGLTVLAVAAVLVLLIPSQSVSLAAALAPVVETLEGSAGLHLVGAVRSRSGEPFDFVALDSPLEKQELWIEAGPYGPARMRMEKPDRVVAFDGSRTVFYDRRSNEYAESAGGLVPPPYLDPERWIRTLLDREAGGVEVEIAETGKGRELAATIREKGLPVEGRAPAFWNEFDRRTEIRWDKETNRLLELRRFVAAGPRELLVAEIARIEYVDRIDAETFRLQTPAGARKIEVIAAAGEYDRLGPGEAAREFWTAAMEGDWERARIFCPSPAVIDHLRDDRPVEILEIGEPFRTGGYAGWYVPYRVRFESGRTTAHNLALRNDNAFGRFVTDGGI